MTRQLPEPYHIAICRLRTTFRPSLWVRLRARLEGIWR